jgi:hypothetical protein
MGVVFFVAFCFALPALILNVLSERQDFDSYRSSPLEALSAVSLAGLFSFNSSSAFVPADVASAFFGATGCNATVCTLCAASSCVYLPSATVVVVMTSLVPPPPPP